MRKLALTVAIALSGCATTLDKARDARGLGEYDDARLLYEEAMVEPKTEDVARQELAQMYVDRAAEKEGSDARAAEQDYRRSLAVDPVYAEALTALVRMLRKQDRLADARRVIGDARNAGSCPACNRLELVVVLEEADAAAKGGRWKVALAAYGQAQEVRPQPSVALSIVRAHIKLKAHADAVAALQDSVPLMIEADASAKQTFVGLRATLFSYAIDNGLVPLADQVRSISMANEPAEPLFAMEIRVADYVMDSVDVELALARLEAMAARKGEQALDAEQTEAVRSRIARVYANRGTALLNKGQSNNADQAFKKAIEIRPDDWPLRLQRIVAISETVGSRKALESLRGVPEETFGLQATRGILASLRVRELVKMGELEAARIALEAVQAEHGELAEGHLVAAMVLAKTPVDDLSRKQRKAALGPRSLVTYPGEVFRYAEALAELAWVKTAMAATSKDKLFVAPWLSTDLAELDRELRTVYPHVVEFRADPEPVIVLHNTTGVYIDVVVKGPDGMVEELGIPTGDRTEITAPTSGLLNVTIDRTKRVFVAEPYCKVTLRL